MSVWTIRELKMLIWVSLRHGSAHCQNSWLSDLERIIPELVKMGVSVRLFADSGYESKAAFRYLDKHGVGFMIVQKQHATVKRAGRYARKKKTSIKYRATFKERLLLCGNRKIRQIFLQVHEAYNPTTGQLYFKEFLSDEFTNAFATNMHFSVLQLYRLYRGHAVVETVIEELKNDFEAVKSHGNNFAMNECHTLIAGLAYNLKSQYIRHLKGREAPVPKLSSVRECLIDIPGYFANHSGRKVLNVARDGYPVIAQAITRVKRQQKVA